MVQRRRPTLNRSHWRDALLLGNATTCHAQSDPACGCAGHAGHAAAAAHGRSAVGAAAKATWRMRVQVNCAGRLLGLLQTVCVRECVICACLCGPFLCCVMACCLLPGLCACSGFWCGPGCYQTHACVCILLVRLCLSGWLNVVSVSTVMRSYAISGKGSSACRGGLTW